MKHFQLYITAAAFLAIGFILGMIVQQGIVQGTLMKVAGEMDGVEINVNFNETKMMDALYDNLEESGFMDVTNETDDVEWAKSLYNNGTPRRYGDSDVNVLLDETEGGQ